MSLPVKTIYEFGEFRLDPQEKILMRGDALVELTPKGFELLCVLVENHGRLLQKNELMDRIWADSFVEESNLTFNIRQLRKILGDDAQNPKYIKTVRQHGYRFIADVKRIAAEEDKEKVLAEKTSESATAAATTALPDFQPAAEIIAPLAGQPTGKPKSKNFFAPALVASVVLLGAAAGIASWYARNRNAQPNAPVLSASFASEKLSTDGRVLNALISPDGKNVVYTTGKDTEKESVWLRQLDAGGGNVEIIPPSDDLYYGLTLSPDGTTLYFVRKPRLTDEPMAIYCVPIFGGIPQKIVSQTQGWISISPDGKKISFVRCPFRDDEYCSLWIADAADGGSERKLVARARPFRIGDNEFAPDGKSVAFAVGQSENSGNEFALAEVDVETGIERSPSKERFFNIKSLTWLPDKSGWLITSSRVHTRNVRIWQISASTGEAAPVTKDSQNYGQLSLDKKATKIVSTIIEPDFDARLLGLENPAASRTIADANSLSFAPNGKIYFSSGMSGNEEIWSINADGSGKRQLTSSEADESLPLATPDGNSIIFISNRTGAAQVWRMNADGSNQTQVTNKEGGYPLFVAPDGEWVYYHHGINRTLWRVSLKTGEEQIALEMEKTYFAVSPDASLVAYSQKQSDERILTVAALADGQQIKTFPLADKKSLLLQIAWMPDGKNLAYVTANRDYGNNVLWTQSLDAADAPRQIAALGDEEISGFGLAISPDGKTFGITQGEWLHDAVLLKGLR